MTGCRAWMMLGLMVWRLVLAMARAVECLVRCCGGCRGFAQLREGSDDPPPLVRMGASAWADAMPKPASRPSRMVVIAKVRRRRETRCMKPKPLHQTPNGTNTACLFKVLPVGKPHIAQRQPCIGLQEPMAEASRLLDIPRFSPYHPARKQHTRCKCAAAGQSNNSSHLAWQIEWADNTSRPLIGR